MSTTEESLAEGKNRQVVVSIDDRPVTTPKHTTPGALLTAAGIDPAKRKLVRVDGRQSHKLEDLDAEITVREDEAFITVRIGPTPVS